MIAGYLHDTGRVYIPLKIVEKQGELNGEELLQVREHRQITGEILSAFSEPGEIIHWTAEHHEKLDGSGYPFHLDADYLQFPDGSSSSRIFSLPIPKPPVAPE
jgi:HD-GYP domain-containing protein (c-di-GMP phosphodiesterase class II)